MTAQRSARNPRRAYDRDGREIPPATVGSNRANGSETIQVHCNGCGHGVVLGLTGLPDALAIPDVPLTLRLRCGRCGSRSIGVMIDVTAHYERIRGAFQGAPVELPEDYRVTPWQDVVGPERAARIASGQEKSAPAEAGAPGR